MLTQTQQLGQKLQQRLSPQQILAVRLIELPVMELGERIKEELQNNPALEEGSTPTTDNEDDLFNDTHEEEQHEELPDFSLGDYLQEDDIPDYKLREMAERADRKEMPASAAQSLGEILLQQLRLRNLSQPLLEIGVHIIGTLDADGYLRRSCEEIAEDIALLNGKNVDIHDIVRMVSVVQDMEPHGVAAHDLQECLLLQLKKKEKSPAVNMAITLLSRFFDDFSNKRYDRIAHSLQLDDRTLLKEAVDEITSLNPKPGNDWGGFMDNAVAVIPDFIVEIHNGELLLSLNGRDVPPLHISPDFAALLHDFSGNAANRTAQRLEAIQFIKQKIDTARAFILAIQQRQETLQRTMQVILLLQREFFLSGRDNALKPMILKDVALHTGLDISTISRVSNSKYVQTPHGIYPLKYFFTDALTTDNGEEVSTRAVKTLLRELIRTENKQQPLTDEKLVDLLNSKGYSLARRTVAKYREQMEIPTARLRKVI
jgi:RNA polymerase sigma-54 factor